MFFKRPKSCEAIFSNHYHSMLRIAKSSSIANNPEFELLPAMFAVCALASTHKDKKFSDAIMAEINLLYSDLDVKKFWARCNLYQEIVYGKELRCEWFSIGDPTAFSDNAISKCAALFADIMYNPECADDYDNAPVATHGIFAALDFAKQVVAPLTDELVELFKEMYSA